MRGLNTTILRNNAKDLPSKIKEEDNNNSYKDNILMQKYEDKKNNFILSNYKIVYDEIKNLYNIKNRDADVFD